LPALTKTSFADGAKSGALPFPSSPAAERFAILIEMQQCDKLNKVVMMGGLR
jgi:hypothetical protein